MPHWTLLFVYWARFILLRLPVSSHDFEKISNSECVLELHKVFGSKA